MPPLNDATMRALLGAVITLGFFVVVFVVLFVPVPSTVRDIVLVLLGALIASFKEVTGFFFGSSAGAVTANATLARQAVPTSTEPIKIDDSTPIAVVETKV